MSTVKLLSQSSLYFENDDTSYISPSYQGL